MPLVFPVRLIGITARLAIALARLRVHLLSLLVVVLRRGGRGASISVCRHGGVGRDVVAVPMYNVLVSGEDSCRGRSSLSKLIFSGVLSASSRRRDGEAGLHQIKKLPSVIDVTRACTHTRNIWWLFVLERKKYERGRHSAELRRKESATAEHQPTALCPASYIFLPSRFQLGCVLVLLPHTYMSC
ncbi:unnamed protein product, partial [Scytosiphon promiscuus]